LISYTLLGHRFDIIGWHGYGCPKPSAIFPLAALIMEGVLQSIPPSLEYAGRNLGCHRTEALPHHHAPSGQTRCRRRCSSRCDIRPWQIFGNPIMIAGSFTVLPTEAWARVSAGDVTGAAVLTSILLMPAFLFFLFQDTGLERGSIPRSR